MRPAAAEWDEREETPWPIIGEAQKIGLYGFEALAQFWATSGLTLPIVNEELFWGDAGIGMAIMGTSLAVAAIFGGNTGEQIGEWIPQSSARRGAAVAAFCVSEPDAGSDVSSLRTRAVYDRPRTSGSSTARRRGRPTAASPACTSSWPPSTRSSARAGRRRSWSRPARPG